MDEPNPTKTHQTATKSESKPKANASNLFLGCFGFSGKPSSKVDRKPSWFSRSTSLLKQSAASTKTVPVDSDEKLQAKRSLTSRKSSIKKINSDIEIFLEPESRLADQDNIQTFPSEAANHGSPHESCCDKKIIPENGKHLDIVVDSPKRSSFPRKIDATRNGSSKPDSPEARPKSNRTANPLSASFLITSNPLEKSRVITKKDRKQNETTQSKFDPIIGMSIVMITLIIMLLWGRLCAVVCTCAWLYFVPRLRVNLGPKEMEKIGLISVEPDFNSEEYKKKVVLEGLLQRNHNRSAL